MSDYLFRGNLAKLDRDVYELTQLEAERQYRKLILIPSESTAPLAVREALSLRLPEHLCGRLPGRRVALDDRGRDPRLPGATCSLSPQW